METGEDIIGSNVIKKALLYANHEWYATEKNVMHGIDANGRFVDTPDITWHGEVLDCGWWKVNQINIGVPYGWGNASTLEEFDKGIKEGKYEKKLWLKLLILHEAQEKFRKGILW
jgi:hypothetical protein